MILREDQLLEPKVQRMIRKREKERERAIREVAEEFQIQGADKKTAAKSKHKGKVPSAIQFGYGRINPNVPKRKKK